MPKLRLGTRSSPLALVQASLVEELLTSRHAGLSVELVHITTTGDRDARPFQVIGERGLFTNQLERELRAGTIDIAVHSLKDLPVEMQPDMALVATLPRADPRDALCGPYSSLHDLPAGARIGTSSLRRGAILQELRPDVERVDVRGNVETRLRTTRERGDSGCILAAAGLARLGLESEVGCFLDVDSFVPEAGQGAIVVQALKSRTQGVDLSVIDDPQTAWATRVERSVGRHLGSGCDVPLGVHVTEERQGYVFAAAPDGTDSVRAATSLPEDEPAAVQRLLTCARQAGVDAVLASGAAG